MSTPFRCEVYDKTFAFKGVVGNPISTTIIPKDMTPGISTIAMAADQRYVSELIKPGARMWFKDADTGDHLMSGWVARYRVSGPEKRSQIEFDVVDDFIVLQRILGWVVPTAAITAQGTAGTNWTSTGPAETVLKAAVTANGVNRLGLPIDVPASAGLGATVKARLRFQSLYDRLIPVEDGAGIINSGIGIGMQQNPDAPGLRLNVWEPRTIVQPLNEKSGVVTRWSLSHDNATMTRGVAGGQGEGQLRLFRERIDTALETSLGWKYEAFRDARDTDDPTTMYERIDETLLENAAKSGLSVELSETEHFRARPGKIWVGDQVTMALQGFEITERLQEVTLSSTASGGYTTRPRVGDRTENPDARLARIIRGITRKLRNSNSDV